MTAGKRKATASLASGNVRLPASCSTPLACHVPNADYRAFAKMCRTCFVLCCVFSTTALTHTSALSRKNAHCTSSPYIFCVRRICFIVRTSTCRESRQARRCTTHLKLSKLFFLRYKSKRRMPDRNVQVLYNYTFFFANKCSFCFHSVVKFDDPPQTTTFCNCLIIWTFLCKIGLVGGFLHRKTCTS